MPVMMTVFKAVLITVLVLSAILVVIHLDCLGYLNRP